MYLRNSFSYRAGGEDYKELMFLMLTFSVENSNSFQHCFNISIIDDSIVEPNQSFMVILSSSDTNVTIDNQQLLVTIIDNDGKFL